MKVFGWLADEGACGYYRVILPLTELQQLGVETHSSTVMPDEARESAEVIVGQRVCQPGATQTWQRLAKDGRVRLVFEVDDDLFNVDSSNTSAWDFFGRSEIRENLRRNIEVADSVICTTEPLADQLSKLNANVFVAPNFIPGWLLDVAPASSQDLVTIGWGGGNSHAMDWREAGSEVVRFIARNGAELHLMGWQPPQVKHYLLKGQYRHTPWQNSTAEYLRSVDFHVGLAPLRPHIFNQSKSHIKALELAALGIPIVASEVGPYPGFVDHGESGFLVRYPHDWGRHLRELLDPATRTAIGEAARQKAAGYTIGGNIELWEKALGL